MREEISPSTEREALVGLLAAVRTPPHPLALTEKLSVVELIRKWLVHALVALTLAGTGVWKLGDLSRQVHDNTTVCNNVKDAPERILKLEKAKKQMRPLVRKMWWQVEQGLTNADLKERGIVPPEFPEED